MGVNSIGIFATAVIGFFTGCLWVNGQQNLEISRLNNELRTRQEEVEKEQKSIENHKQFIRRKDTVVRKFCEEYFPGDKNQQTFLQR